MNILILSWRDTRHPLAGGAESFLHELSKRLVAQHHAVTFVTSSFPGAESDETLEGVNILRRGTQWTVHLKAYLWYKRQPPHAFDLIIDNFHALPFFAPLFAEQPVIGVIHEVTRELWFAESFFPVNVIGYLLEPWFFLPYRNSHFLVASPSTKRDLVRLGHPDERITVFFQGIDMEPLKSPPRKTSRPLLLCLSRISPTKRFEHAIIALSIIKKEVPDATLTIAGSGKPEYLAKLKGLVKDLELSDSVTFAGFLSGSSKLRLLKKSWLILGTSIREGWGLAITEAAACGTPAVTYDVPGFRDSVLQGRTGVRVKPATPERLAQEVISLIRDRTRWQKLADRARRGTLGRTRDQTARQLIPLLERLAGATRPLSKQRINILILSWRDIKSPASGGAEILTHEIAKRLVRWGHEVTVLAPIFPGAANIETVNGVRILRPSFFFADRPIAYLNWPRFLVNAAATYRSQLAQRTDIVIDQVHGLPSFTPLFARKPTILFPLEVANDIWLVEIPFPGNILGWLIERVYLLLFRSFPFLTISPSTARDLLRFGVHNVTTVTPGVNPPPGKLPHKRAWPTFISLGRITRMKRHQDTILAFARFLRRFPNSRLHIVGRGSYLSDLKSLTHHIGVDRWVRFHGYCDESKKYSLLAESWALLSTSIREGWGLNVIEAASVGTPTLAYRVPGIVDTVVNGKTGMLTEQNTPDSLAQAMQRLSEDHSLRLRLGSSAKRYARQFTWEKTADQFLTAITNTLEPKP